MLNVQADICNKFFSIRNNQTDRALQMGECYKMVEEVEIGSYVNCFLDCLQGNMSAKRFKLKLAPISYITAWMNASAHANQIALNRHKVADDIAKHIKKMSVAEIVSLPPSDFGKSLLIEIVTGHELCKIKDLEFQILALLYSKKAMRDCVLASIEEDRRKSDNEALRVEVLANKNGQLISKVFQVLNAIAKCNIESSCLILENPRQLLWESLVTSVAKH